MATTKKPKKHARKDSSGAKRAVNARHLRLVTNQESSTVGPASMCTGGLAVAKPGAWRVLHDDCVSAMRMMPAESVDSICTDPPYALGFLGTEWDIFTAREFQSFSESWGAEALRLLKPGGYLLAFSSARTYHRLTCGLENAGFVIVDQLQWLTGQGMPKARSIGRECGYSSRTALATALKPAHEPIVVAQKPRTGTYVANVRAHGVGALHVDDCRVGSVVTTAEVPGRWPPNVLLGHSSTCRQLSNVQVGCRAHWGKTRVSGYGAGIGRGRAEYYGIGKRPGEETVERWQCSPNCPVGTLDRQSIAATSSPEVGASRYFHTVGGDVYATCESDVVDVDALPIADILAAEAPSYLYCPKVKGASERDAGLDSPVTGAKGVRRSKNGHDTARTSSSRGGAVRLNTHTTVKPIALMRWLLRLVTPPGGLTLDPFCGSGSTGCAVMVENGDPERAPGWSFIGVEREAEHVATANARIAHWALSGTVTKHIIDAVLGSVA